MGKKKICPTCGGSLWSFIRNGEYVAKCGNCGWEAVGEDVVDTGVKKKLKWEPTEDFLPKEEDPVVEEPKAEPEVPAETVIDDIPQPEELLAPEEKVEEPAPVEEPAAEEPEEAPESDDSDETTE